MSRKGIVFHALANPTGRKTQQHFVVESLYSFNSYNYKQKKQRIISLCQQVFKIKDKIRSAYGKPPKVRMNNAISMEAR